MNINETTILGGAVGIITTIFTILFKRHIDRVDALEKANTAAQVSRAATAEIINSMSINLMSHMTHEERDIKDMRKAIAEIHESVAILASKAESK